MKYFGGCDVGSTYTKAVILDENGKMVADTTIKSKINSEASAVAAMAEVCEKAGLKSSKDLEYLIGTGYGRNKVPCPSPTRTSPKSPATPWASTSPTPASRPSSTSAARTSRASPLTPTAP